MIHHSAVPVITQKQKYVIPRTAQAWKEMEQPNLIPPPSRAMGFMTTRPGGPIQEQNRNMKAKECQVVAHMQTKCTSSTTGRKALLTLTSTMTKNNTDNTKVVSCANKWKSHSTTRKQTTRKKKVTTGTAKVTKEGRGTRPTCTNGCKHVGWVEMLQMTPKDTKYSLGKGNFFYGKSCTDCTIPITTLFENSKHKALFYYCPIDYNVLELDDENNEFAAKSCACILCIPCYFGRENKPTAATTTRKSGLVHKQQ
jgi:hypothetical protein